VNLVYIIQVALIVFCAVDAQLTYY